MEVVMTTLNSARSDGERPEVSLAGRYGKIGIPALAAALRYQHDANRPALPNSKVTKPLQSD